MEDFNHPYPKLHYQFRIIKFLLPLILLPLLFQFFKPFLTQLFTDTIGKSYMFLLCNGLLVLIAMNSGLINAPSPTTHQSIEEVAAIDINERSNQLEFNVSEIAAAPPAVADENVMEIEPPQEKEESLAIAEQQNVISEDAKEDKNEDEGNAVVIIAEDEHGVEDTEELNKKCEDFIRKMKAAFYSEPRADYSHYFDNQKAMVAVN